jgi:hypothetical protein
MGHNAKTERRKDSSSGWRLCVVALLALALGSVRAPAQQPDAGEGERADEVVLKARLAERIAGLLNEVAYDARAVDDPSVRLSCQMQAAGLLWSREPERAREIYVEAFEALLPSQSSSTEERDRAIALMPDVLAGVARRDPALAERLADRFALVKVEGSSSDRAAERAEALAAAAIEMLPGDPARAADLARLALSERLTPNVMRLLVVLRGVDAARADALFATAIGVLARAQAPRIGDVQMLAFYVGANGSTKLDGVPADALRAYLEIAFRQIVLTPLDSRDASTVYFLGRQLAGAFGRHLPHRLPELESRIALLASSSGFQDAAMQAADRTGDTADARHARAATAAIERDDYRTVHAEAAAIEDGDLQTRVYAQASLHLIRQRRLDEAAREIRRVPDPARRATLLIPLALAAYSRDDIASAVETLSWASREAGRSERPGARLQALFSIASAYVAVDQLLAFDAMRAAIEAVNRALLAEKAEVRKTLAPGSLNFDATLARLARLDFDRALLLAQEFDSRGHELMAVLAVCKGGLAFSGDAGIAEELDDAVAHSGQPEAPPDR